MSAQLLHNENTFAHNTNIKSLFQESVIGELLLNKTSSTASAQSVRSVKAFLDQKKSQIFIKRVFDITVSSLLIIFLSPILIITALLVRLSSRGPILYSNDRVGYKGVNFRCFKFRSMITDQSAKKNDYEILFNVLKGDMSIIGPRPLVPFMLAHLSEFKEIRCFVRPGITGLWQIRDRVNNTSAEFMIEHDTEYIKNYSLLLDLEILIKTPFVVISGEGAY